jgi:hypothetical protein
MTATLDAQGQASLGANGLAVPSGVATASAAPGATGPGAQMSMTYAVVSTLGVAAAGIVALGILFRRGGQKLPPLRIDAANALNIYFSWLLIDGTLKLVAYHYHGHKLAQAYLLVA